MDLIYWSICSFCTRAGAGVKGWFGGIVIVASYGHHFFRVSENLVQHPSNNVSIVMYIHERDTNISIWFDWSIIWKSKAIIKLEHVVLPLLQTAFYFFLANNNIPSLASKTVRLEPVLSHTEKSCISSYYRQFSTNIKIKS